MTPSERSHGTADRYGARRMNAALTRLRLAIDERKWILWVLILLVIVLAWFIAVALLPHHVINTIRHYEEQPNGVREYPQAVRE